MGDRVRRAVPQHRPLGCRIRYARLGSQRPRRARRARGGTPLLVPLHRRRCAQPRRTDGDGGGAWCFARAAQARRRLVPAVRARLLHGIPGDGRRRAGPDRAPGRLHLRVVLGRAAHPPPRGARVPFARRLSGTLRPLQGRSVAAGSARGVPVAPDLGRSRGRERLRSRRLGGGRRARVVPRASSGRLPRVLRAPAAAAARPALRTVPAHAHAARVRRSRERPDARRPAVPQPAGLSEARPSRLEPRQRLRRAHRTRTLEARRAAGSVARGASRREQGSLEPARTGHGHGQHRRATRAGRDLLDRWLERLPGGARASVRDSRRRRACATPSASPATSIPSWPRA